MTTGEIEELFYKHTGDIVIMDFEQFTQAIKQSKLEGYRELLNNLIRINGDCNVDLSLLEYIDSIHDKIKELEQWAKYWYL